MSDLHWRHRKRLNELLDGKIPESCRYKRGACATFREVIDELRAAGAGGIYVAGGIVRDLIAGEPINKADLDIKFTGLGKEGLISVFGKMRLASRVDAKAAYTYFFVGCDEDNNMEGYMSGATTVESPANAMLIDVATMRLHDPTGVGVSDAKARVWRAPPGADLDEWFYSPGGIRLLWRMLKFRGRGYSAPDGDVGFLYRKSSEAIDSGGVSRFDARNLLTQTDVCGAMCAMIGDAASGRAPANHVMTVASFVLRSGEVWQPRGASRRALVGMGEVGESGSWSAPRAAGAGGPERALACWRMMVFRARGIRVSPADVRTVYGRAANAIRDGLVSAGEYKSLLATIDPVSAIEMLMEDGCRGAAPEADVAAILRGVLESGEVVRRAQIRGNVPFQETCARREEEMARRKGRPA